MDAIREAIASVLRPPQGEVLVALTLSGIPIDGSAPYSCNPEMCRFIAARLETIDGDPGIRPEKHQFTDYAAQWEAIPDGLPCFPESSRSAA